MRLHRITTATTTTTTSVSVVGITLLAGYAALSSGAVARAAFLAPPVATHTGKGADITASPIVARLSAVRGVVNVVLKVPVKALRVRRRSTDDGGDGKPAANGMPLRGGDVVIVAPGGGSTIYLLPAKTTYTLGPGSRVRIAGDGRSLRSLAGPLPRRLSASAAGLSSPHIDERGFDGRIQASVRWLTDSDPSPNPNADTVPPPDARVDARRRRRLGALAPLFDGRLSASVQRGSGQGDEKSGFAPCDPSPLFGLVEAKDLDGNGKRSVALRWGGVMDPAAGTGTHLRLRVSDQQSGDTAYYIDLGPGVRSVTLPPGTLTPGRWYLWSVALSSGGDTPSVLRRVGGSLRLLIPEERASLEKALKAAAASNSSNPDLVRGRAYESVGLVYEAITAYESALNTENLKPVDAEEVRADLKLLRSLPGSTFPDNGQVQSILSTKPTRKDDSAGANK